MIFVILGSQKFQFNRLLKEIDRLIEEGGITEEVFAQIGYSDYRPKNYKYKEFLNRDEFNEVMSRCDKVITHGGTGAIVGAIKKEKKVIAVPRLANYGEHVDDHQLQITQQFTELKFIQSICDVSELKNYINCIDSIKFQNYVSNTDNIIESIERFILLSSRLSE